MMDDLRKAVQWLPGIWENEDCSVDLPRNQEWADGVAQGYKNAAAHLRSVLTAHPAESAPRPVIDREAVEIAARNTIAEWYGAEWNATEDKFYETYDGGGVSCVDDEAMLELRGVRLALDRVMGLARPMPTPDAIAIALFEHDQEASNGFRYSWQVAGTQQQARYLDRAEAVLALLAGGES